MGWTPVRQSSVAKRTSTVLNRIGFGGSRPLLPMSSLGWNNGDAELGVRAYSASTFGDSSYSYSYGAGCGSCPQTQRSGQNVTAQTLLPSASTPCFQGSGSRNLPRRYSQPLNGSQLSPTSTQRDGEVIMEPGVKGPLTYVMLPLDTVNGDGVFRYAGSAWFLQALQLLTSSGVHGVAMDFWWGAVEKNPGQYNWSGYKQALEVIKQTGLKVQAVLSFHACGGNVGDTVQIPLPEWVLQCGVADPDLFFADRPRNGGLGNRNREYISIWADESPGVLRGRSPIQCYEDFMASLRDNFGQELGTVIDEVVVGAGPCGELRLPSYVEANGWRFPGVGEFQCYDRRALASLAQAAREAGHPEWGYTGPHDAGDYNSTPDTAGFFSPNGSWSTPYGRFFLEWYSNCLLQHGHRLLTIANAVFGAKLHTPPSSAYSTSCGMALHRSVSQTLQYVSAATSSGGRLNALSLKRILETGNSMGYSGGQVSDSGITITAVGLESGSAGAFGFTAMPPPSGGQLLRRPTHASSGGGASGSGGGGTASVSPTCTNNSSMSTLTSSGSGGGGPGSSYASLQPLSSNATLVNVQQGTAGSPSAAAASAVSAFSLASPRVDEAPSMRTSIEDVEASGAADERNARADPNARDKQDSGRGAVTATVNPRGGEMLPVARGSVAALMNSGTPSTVGRDGNVGAAGAASGSGSGGSLTASGTSNSTGSSSINTDGGGVASEPLPDVVMMEVERSEVSQTSMMGTAAPALLTSRPDMGTLGQDTPGGTVNVNVAPPTPIDVPSPLAAMRYRSSLPSTASLASTLPDAEALYGQGPVFAAAAAAVVGTAAVIGSSSAVRMDICNSLSSQSTEFTTCGGSGSGGGLPPSMLLLDVATSLMVDADGDDSSDGVTSVSTGVTTDEAEPDDLFGMAANSEPTRRMAAEPPQGPLLGERPTSAFATATKSPNGSGSGGGEDAGETANTSLEEVLGAATTAASGDGNGTGIGAVPSTAVMGTVTVAAGLQIISPQLSPTGPCLASAGGRLHLALKIAGIHWWYRSRSHAAELTAGYYNVDGRDGYAPIVDLCARHRANLVLTCVEMCDAQHPAQAYCGPEGLLRQLRTLAARAGVLLSGENALPIFSSSGVDAAALDRIVNNVRSVSLAPPPQQGRAPVPPPTPIVGNGAALPVEGYPAMSQPSPGNNNTPTTTHLPPSLNSAGSTSAGTNISSYRVSESGRVIPVYGVSGQNAAPASQDIQQQPQQPQTVSGGVNGAAGPQESSSTVISPEVLPALRAFTFLRLVPEMLFPRNSALWGKFMGKMAQV